MIVMETNDRCTDCWCDRAQSHAIARDRMAKVIERLHRGVGNCDFVLDMYEVHSLQFHAIAI